MDGTSLLALARKYRTLAGLRRQKARTGEHTPREVMRALAREFPGSLRELDVLPLSELDRRVALIESGAPEPWMRWMASFHSLLRAALHIKARLQGDKSITDERAEALARSAGVDAAFARACANPPLGRVQEVVLAEVAKRHHAPEAEVRAALSPRRPTLDEVAAEKR